MAADFAFHADCTCKCRANREKQENKDVSHKEACLSAPHALPDSIQDALSRLAQALDRLDAASLRHAEGERLRATLEAELALMREDRHRLATEIDKERDERLTLEARLADITPRIDRAMDAIRVALSDQEK